MKLLLITLTFMSISFEVFGKDTFYSCKPDNSSDDEFLKVEDTYFGERKLFRRDNGIWVQLCDSDRDVITDDSFICYNTTPEKPEGKMTDQQFFEYLKIYNKFLYPSILKWMGNSLKDFDDYFIFDQPRKSIIRRYGNPMENYSVNYTCTKSE